jgi:hypothetical protein
VSIDGHDFTAFVGFVPVEAGDTFTVILYDASGLELERHEMAAPQPRDLRASISSSLRSEGTS